MLSRGSRALKDGWAYFYLKYTRGNKIYIKEKNESSHLLQPNLSRMPRKIGPERAHFGGLVTETHDNGTRRYYWRCNYCPFQLGGQVFQNRKARIHLSGDTKLRNGIVATVCQTAPKAVKEEFTLLVQQKRQSMDVQRQKRKRQNELLQCAASTVKPVAKQSKLRMSPARLEDEEVNEAWGKAFFCLDIPVNKVCTPAFREAIAATKRSKPAYKGPDRHKLYGPVLERLYRKCTQEQKQFLAQRTGYGRAVTGDGATILGTKFINFLCHEKGKGVMLCKIKDCTGRLAEVGSIQATFIAHELIDTIRFVYVFSYILIL